MRAKLKPSIVPAPAKMKFKAKRSTNVRWNVSTGRNRNKNFHIARQELSTNLTTREWTLQGSAPAGVWLQRRVGIIKIPACDPDLGAAPPRPDAADGYRPRRPDRQWCGRL